MDELMRMFGWSMNVLLSGESPLLDYRRREICGGGQVLVGGHRRVLAQCRGDRESYVSLF